MSVSHPPNKSPDLTATAPSVCLESVCISFIFGCPTVAVGQLRRYAPCSPSLLISAPISSAVGSGAASIATSFPDFVILKVLPICTWSMTSPGLSRSAVIEISSVLPSSSLMSVRRWRITSRLERTGGSLGSLVSCVFMVLGSSPVAEPARSAELIGRP